MKSALVNLVIGLGQLIQAYYADADRETMELQSAIVRWLEKHKDDRR